MTEYNIHDPYEESGLICGRHPSDPTLKNPNLFPHWPVADCAAIFGYDPHHVHLLYRTGRVTGWHGVSGRFIDTRSMVRYVALQNGKVAR
jgi:hypothetical protein